MKVWVIIAVLALGLVSATVFANGGVGQEQAEEARQKHTAALLDIDGVVGVGLGNGTVTVLTTTDEVPGIPVKIDNVPTQVIRVGDITVQCHKGWSHGPHQCPPTPTPVPNPGTGPCTETLGKYRPACIGVSSGHVDVTACTIGTKVTDGINVYALSNNHCYANGNLANIGDPIVQPGTVDGGVSPADDFGTLAAFKPVSCVTADNTIDAAIATINDTDLVNGTPSDGYGAPTSITVPEVVGLDVMKYGRTTQQTVGQITSVNTTIEVGGYPCGTAIFVDQMIIQPGSFGSGGDSGSLVVDLNRNPVGLYFAGSVFVGVANPIDLVLTEFGVTVSE